MIALFALTAKAIGIDECIGQGTGALQCCNAVKNSSDPEVIATLKALNITLPQPDVLFGLNCTAHGFPGLGGNPCGKQVAAVHHPRKEMFPDVAISSTLATCQPNPPGLLHTT